MSRRPGRSRQTALLAAVLCVASATLCAGVASADLPAVTVTGGAATDPGGALTISAADNPAGLTKLSPPVAGKALFPRRSDGLLQAGIDVGTAISSGVDPGPLAQTVAAAHLSMGRLPANWAYIEPHPDQYNYSTLDAGYKALVRAGVRPLITLQASPGWAVSYRGDALDDGCNGEFCVQPPDPSQYARWARFAGAVARRYPLAGAIEVWNEPNLWGFWHAGDVDPAAYERLLASAYDAIKAANPAMRVLGGSINNLAASKSLTQADCSDRYAAGLIEGTAKYNDCRTKHDIGYADFLRGLLAAGGAAKMDGLSLHPYPVNASQVGLTSVFIDTHSVLAAAGDASMRLVATEVGSDTPSAAWPSTQSQADAVLETYEALSGSSDKLTVVDASHIDAVLFFESVEVGRGYGWLDQSSTGALTPRPVYCLMADRLGSRPAQCPGAELFKDGVTTPATAHKKKKPAKKKKTKKKKTARHGGHDIAQLQKHPISYSLGLR